MCGRVVSKVDFPTLQRITRTNLSHHSTKYTKSYNLSPGCYQAALIHSKAPISFPAEETHKCEDTAPDQVLSAMKWGFHLPTSRKFLFNIRAETAAVKFSSLAAANRCVIVASGYYEWTAARCPYYLFPASSPLLYLAGVYIEEGGELKAAVLTKQAPERLSWLHERTPCILAETDIARWIDVEKGWEDVIDYVLGDKVGEVGLTWHRVSRLISTSEKEGEDLCLPLEEYNRKIRTGGIHQFFQPVNKRKRAQPEAAAEMKRAKMEDQTAKKSPSQ